jgi:hypothetical protein
MNHPLHAGRLTLARLFVDFRIPGIADLLLLREFLFFAHDLRCASLGASMAGRGFYMSPGLKRFSESIGLICESTIGRCFVQVEFGTVPIA